MVPRPRSSSECHSSLLSRMTSCRCCNNCEQVREAYRLKGWAFNNADGIVQCEREGWTDKLKEQANEGCAMYGYLLVNKVCPDLGALVT